MSGGQSGTQLQSSRGGGGIRLESHQIRWFAWWPGGRLDCINGQRPETLKGELENNSRKPRGLLKNRHSDSLKKNQLTLSQGMMKKGDICDDADDDKVRTRTSQNHATALVCTEEFFLRTQYICIALPLNQQRYGRAGYTVDSQLDLNRQFQLGFSTQLDLHIAK